VPLSRGRAMPRHASRPAPTDLGRRIPSPGWLAEVLRDESRAGLLLALAAVAALSWATADAHGYGATWSQATWPGVGLLRAPRTVLAWVDDGAMALFFLVVGLELSRGLVHGDLRDARTGLLPVGGALGGMGGAALAYLALAHGPTTARGYGVPMATDIAFSLAALALVGRRVPGALRLFVLALAVSDDLGSLAVLVLGYSSRLAPWRVGAAVACCGVLAGLRRLGVRRPGPYLLVGLCCWGALEASGVEPALAGVAAGVAIPPGGAHAGRLEHLLRPAVNALVLPAFALANAGVALGDLRLTGGSRSIFVGVLAARLLGKGLGVALGTVVAARLLGVPRPDGLGGRRLLGAGAICGVGFTVPLLVARQAFASWPAGLAAARAALLAGSLACLAVGALLLASSSEGRSRR